MEVEHFVRDGNHDDYVVDQVNHLIKKVDNDVYFKKVYVVADDNVSFYGIQVLDIKNFNDQHPFNQADDNEVDIMVRTINVISILVKHVTAFQNVDED